MIPQISRIAATLKGAFGFVSAERNPLTGRSEISAGTERISLDDAYALPSGTVRITATQIVIGHPIGLKSVSCVAGSAITLTLYDNGTVGAGNKLYEKAMSAGDKITFPTAIQAVNGILATYTGTATFDIEVQHAG